MAKTQPSWKPVVLIIDDEPSVRQVLVRYFRIKGFEALEAASGREAVDLFKQHRPHVVLLDLMMPGMDGFETLKNMRAIFPEFKAIIISAVNDEVVFKKCKEMGALDYIVKPFNLDYLEARVSGKILW